jgi:subtilisin family serine protease
MNEERPRFNIALAGFIVLLTVFTAIAVLGSGRITGFFAGTSWENSTQITVNNSFEFVKTHLVFGDNRPTNCSAGILIEMPDKQQLSFTTLNEVYDDVGFCAETDVLFNNFIYNTSDEPITYTVYWGKIEKQITAESTQGAQIQSEVTEALETNDTVPVAIVIEPARPDVAAEAKDAVTDTLANTESEYFPKAKAFAAEVSREQVNELQNISGITVEVQKQFTIGLSASVPYINATKVWPIQVSNTNITGKGITVCIIDTGVDYTHVALGSCMGTTCKVLGGYDFANDDSDPMDDNSHGTHVAGIVASTNDTYRGVAPDANLVAIKSFTSTGSASSETIANGIRWCTDNRTAFDISIISMSFGDGGSYSSADCPNDTLIDPELQAAYAAGILLVASSGNSYSTTGVAYPACAQNVIAVGATGRDNDNVASFSNSGDLLDLLAPGVTITSTVLGNNFGAMSGTSMAAPHVSGAAALLAQYVRLSEGRTPTPFEILNRLEKSGVNVTDSRNGITRPRINVYSALLPIVRVESPLNETYNYTSLQFNISTENSNEIYASEATFSIDGGNESALQNDSAIHWYSNTTNVSAGRHIVTFNVKDNLGDTHRNNVQFSADLSPPAISLISPTNNTNISAGEVIKLNITDDVAIANAWYSYNSTNISLIAPYEINTTNINRGQYDIVVFANDSFGNVVSQGYSWFINNNTAPVITSISTNRVPKKNETVTCNAVASDAESDAITIFYSWLNGTNVLATSQTLNCNSVSCIKGLVLTCSAIPNDGQANGTAATVNVTVANSPPAWNMPVVDYYVNANSSITVTTSATDIDNDHLTYSVTNMPSNATINSTTGVFTWTPSDSYLGNNNLIFTVSDGTAIIDLDIFVHVNGTSSTNTSNFTNHPPILFTIDSQAATVGTKFSINITASDEDMSAHNDSLTFLDNTTLFAINKTSNTTAKIEFTPASSQIGNYSINITVKDLYNGSDSQVFSLAITKAITVTSANATSAATPSNKTFETTSANTPTTQTPAAVSSTPTAYATLFASKNFASISTIVAMTIIVCLLMFIIGYRTYPPKMPRQFYRPQPPPVQWRPPYQPPPQIPPTQMPPRQMPMPKPQVRFEEGKTGRKPPPDLGFF